MGSLRSLRRKERPEPVAPPVPSDIKVLNTIYRGTISQLKALLVQGANPDAQNEDAKTALEYAASYGKIGMVKVLVKYGANVNHRDSDRSTALHGAISFACRMLHPICTFLLDRSADPNAVDSRGNTPLMKAVLYREFDVAKLLLERGANATLRNNNGHRAIDLLRRGKGSESLRKLLKQVS